MINKTEIEERQYLGSIKDRLRNTLDKIDERVQNYSKELQSQKDYLWENKAGMDHVEKVSVRQSVQQAALTGEAALERKKLLKKLMLSPWFGRIDFIKNSNKNETPVYIGIHAYYDETKNKNIIHDWRAPVSSMFYDYELGEAKYSSPSGNIKGKITLKRQYRIRNGKMEYMIESSVSIHDEILQQELSRASDDKMKHIVATIQRDQNLIIRNESSHELIIQGVAGSGKTSIALHRIAFLLYRYKDSISSEDILIISPNKVFADYISNVLPELGEEKIPEISMEELANDLLENKFKFQNFYDQVSALFDKNDDKYKERIRYKSSSEVISHLNAYLTSIENHHFSPHDILVKRYPVPAWFIEERFKAYHRLPLFKRMEEIVKDIEKNIFIYFKYEINGKERNEIRREVKNMFRTTNLRQLYKDFYQWMEKPHLFKYARQSTYEYADVFPLIYLKIKLEGVKVNDKVKHLLVDEMQDYTPVQYAVLSKLYVCKKTILGDANQSVNPYSFSTAEKIKNIFPGADSVILNKSYRSSYEITRFAQKIFTDDKLVPVERHGEEPEVLHFKTKENELAFISKTLHEFHESGYNSLGIICKTQKKADKLFGQLKMNNPQIVLITSESMAFSKGVIIASAHMAKGLEFDHVIVPEAGEKNYSEAIDRRMLYIACTRAMHKLNVLYTGKISPFISNAN